MFKKITLLFIFTIILSLSSLGEITDSSANHFSITIKTTIHSPVTKAYKSFIQIGNWWDSSHTYSGNSHNLYIEEKANGCFGEKLENGGSVTHMTISYIQPENTIRMIGGLGPLQEWAIYGSMTISFNKKDSNTEIILTYNVSGYHPKGVQSWAVPVNAVLTMQMMRLKNYIEQ